VQVVTGGTPTHRARPTRDVQVVLDPPEVDIALEVCPERRPRQAGSAPVVALEEHDDAGDDEQKDRSCNESFHGS
jgi:hypothetical protein